MSFSHFPLWTSFVPSPGKCCHPGLTVDILCQEYHVPSVLKGLAVQGSLLNGAVTWDLVSVDEPGQ